MKKSSATDLNTSELLIDQMHLRAPSSPENPRIKMYSNLLEGPVLRKMPDEQQRFTSEVVPMITNDSESKEGSN